MPVTLDVATKVIDQEQRIWAIFPGNYRKFLDKFREERVVFLDMPGLNLTPAALQDDDLLRKHVAMSIAFAEFHTGHRNDRPTKRVASYDSPQTASFSAAVGNVRSMFVRMRADDLVLVSGRGYYEPILVGEIQGPFDPEHTTTYRSYGDDRIPVRRVRWLGGRHERRYLSERLSHLLSNRKAIIAVDKDIYGDEVYRLAYDDYVFGTESRYVFRGPIYRNIATQTVPGTVLITYFCAAFNAADLNELDKFARLAIREAIQNYFEGDILNSFELDFHSPGQYILAAKRAALPLLVAVLVSATNGNLSFHDAKTAMVTNSAEAMAPIVDAPIPDGCMVEIQKKYSGIMESINADRYNEWCKLNKEAQSGVGLKVNVKQNLHRR